MIRIQRPAKISDHAENSDVFRWLLDNFRAGGWVESDMESEYCNWVWYRTISNDTTTICFKHPEDAVLFALRWP